MAQKMRQLVVEQVQAPHVHLNICTRSEQYPVVQQVRCCVVRIVGCRHGTNGENFGILTEIFVNLFTAKIPRISMKFTFR